MLKEAGQLRMLMVQKRAQRAAGGQMRVGGGWVAETQAAALRSPIDLDAGANGRQGNDHTKSGPAVEGRSATGAG